MKVYTDSILTNVQLVHIFQWAKLIGSITGEKVLGQWNLDVKIEFFKNEAEYSR